MNPIFGFVVGLLQSALSLLGFVQQHPELPPAAQLQAQQVATQAISQATKALATNPTSVAKPETLATSPQWKTYTNADYGFSISYPSSWGILDESMDRSCHRDIYVYVLTPADKTLPRDEVGPWSLRIAFKAGDASSLDVLRKSGLGADGPVAQQIIDSLKIGSAKPPLSTFQGTSYDDTAFKIPCGWQVGHTQPMSEKEYSLPFALCAPGTCVFPADSSKPMVSGEPQIVIYNEITSLSTSTPEGAVIVYPKDSTTVRDVFVLKNPQYSAVFQQIVDSFRACREKMPAACF